jgi:hypothetical protein
MITAPTRRAHGHTVPPRPARVGTAEQAPRKMATPRPPLPTLRPGRMNVIIHPVDFPDPSGVITFAVSPAITPRDRPPRPDGLRHQIRRE